MVTDRQALAREAVAALEAMPHVEDEDDRIIIQVLTQRLRLALDGRWPKFRVESQAAAQSSGAALTEQEPRAAST